jgi:site-specific recombinase
VLASAFDAPGDHVWVEAVPAARWCDLFARLAPSFAAGPGRDATLRQLLSAMRVLACRVAALGSDAELLRIHPRLADVESPFLAQAAEVAAVADAELARLEDATLPDPDPRHALVMLDQCDEAIRTVRNGTGTTGISVALTYRLERLSDNIERLRQLLGLVGSEPLPAAAALLPVLVAASNRRNDVREHVARNTELVAREVTEHAGRTGEHYIAADRAEYRAMLGAALGAGLVVPFMALVKLATSALHAPPLVEGVLYSLNYAFGFMLIQVLHFSLATKQPAMTAARLAAALDLDTRRSPDVAAMVELAVRVARTQFVAVVGNVILAFPLAWLVCTAALHATGIPVAAPDKAAHMLHDVHPLASLALLHAAIAGVYLFLAGVISGYSDNLTVFNRIPERVARLPRLVRVAGPARAARLGAYLEHNLGGLAGNFTFGFMLGMTGSLGVITGLPLDIRHVTFSAANVGIAVASLEGLPWRAAVVCALGVGLIGLVNLAVSFTLALLLALKARQVRFRHARPLAAALLRRFVAAPLDFVRPPR